MGDTNESQTFVKRQRLGILGIYARHHDVFAQFGGPFKKGLHECGPDPLRTLVRPDMNGVFDGESVPRPCSEITE